MNTYVWLIRREIWENRALWLMPACVAALLLFVALFGKAQADLPQFSASQAQAVDAMLLFGFGAVLVAIMSVYSAWYLLDCLHADRKDQSILFWKSLPISDAQTVLSKLAMATLVIPFVYFAAADLTALGVAFILSVRFGSALTAGFWRADLWLQLQVLWLYVIIASGLWFLPITGWCLVVSAWAKRAVSLWALFVPLVACYLESKLLGSSLLAHALQNRLFGFAHVAFHPQSHFDNPISFGEGAHWSTPSTVWNLIDARSLLLSEATWEGVAVGVALIALAVALRKRGTEI